MSKSAKDVMLSVSQVIALEPGDADNASWINPGFSGVVESIEQKKTKQGKPFWPCVITDVNDENAEITVSFFTAPKFNEGDLIEIFGQGLRRTEYNGNAQAAVGQKTEVCVVAGGGTKREAQPAPAAPGNTQTQESNYTPVASVASPGFHAKMCANALLYLHSIAYARKINTTLEAQGHKAMPADQFQACVSTLFIAGDRCGLAVNPPAIGTKAPEQAHNGQQTPYAGQGRSDPPARVQGRPKAGPDLSVANNEGDEDIPF